MIRIIQYLFVLIAVCIWPLVLQAYDSETSAKNGDLGLRIFREGDFVRLSWTGRASLESAFSFDRGWSKQSQSSPVIFRVKETINKQYFRARPLLFRTIPGPIDVGDSPSAMAAGDVNGDGRVDAVTANNGSNDLSVLLNQRTFQLKQGKRLAVGDSPSSVVVADLNSDGAVDLLAANSGSNDISVLLNEGHGAFASQQRFDVGDAPSSVAVGDIDGDGMVDVVTGNRDSGDASLLFGKGEGGFTEEDRLDVRHEGGDGRLDLRGTDISSVALGDLNNDGTIDLLVGAIFHRDLGDHTEERGGVVTFLGEGHRSLILPAATIISPIGLEDLPPRSIVLANSSGSDQPEVVVPSPLVDSVTLSSTTFGPEGNSSGTSSRRIKVGESPSSVTVADLNGDGVVDVATANQGSDDVSALIRQGIGFLPEQHFKAGRSPSAIVAIDVNNDGMLDLLAANERSNEVSVILNLAK